MKLLFFHSWKRRASDGKAPVYLRITAGGQSAELSTGIRCTRQAWPAIKRKIDAGNVNETELLKSAAHDARLQLIAQRKHVTGKAIKYCLQPENKVITLYQAFNQYYQHRQQQREPLAAATLYRMQTRFSAIARNTDVYKDINLFTTDYMHFFTSQLQRVYKPGYIVKLIQLLYSIFDYMQLHPNPCSGIRIKRTHPVNQQLQADELRKLTEYNFVQTRLQRIADTFLLMCYTGLSHCDVYKLNTSDWRSSLVVEIARQKTGTAAAAPILPAARAILEKYNGTPPAVSNKTINSYLKECGFVAGMEQTLCTRLARKTFRRICREMGIPVEIAARMMGHRDIRTTQKYYDHITLNDVVQVLSAAG